ncbi:MAG: formate transporter [Solirubrobacteraceae bacterium]|nr:formate transporter [Solirubrobacteraceae bacterium]
MAFKTPQGITEAGITTGVTKAALPPGKLLVGSFLAGAYIAFAGIVAISVSSGLNPQTWGTLPVFFTGIAFVLGLVLVVIAGSELLTGNMALLPLAAFKGRLSVGKVFANFGIVAIGNLLGSLFVAYFLAVKTGVVTDTLPKERLAAIATKKGIDENAWQIFLRGVGCNWLVCLAVWMAMAAEDISGKVLAIFFPIMAFVAIGFDHVVANMFFLPAAIFAHAGDITWGDTIHNWIFAFLGNMVGAGVFVAGAYYYLYGRDAAEADLAPTGRERTPEGRFQGEGAPVGTARDPAAR